MMFNIKYGTFSEDTLPKFTVEVIGYYSIDGESQYHADLSQLKYYIPPLNPEKVSYDLNKNAASTHYRSRTFNNNYTKLDNILRWISENFNLLERPLSVRQERWLNTDFICRRATLKTLLFSPYHKFPHQTGWIICASKYHGSIYLCEYYSDEKEKYYNNIPMKDKQRNSCGYKFEQYMVSDHPSSKSDELTPLNECEEFHCIFKAEFGDHSLLYGAEIDGISSEKPITDINDIKTSKLIELKTVKMYEGNLYNKLQPVRVAEWWSQNYLVNINSVICGLKTNKNIVEKVKTYSTEELYKLSKISISLKKDFDLDLDKCKMFCKIFLDEVKKIVTKNYNECIYKFQWHPSVKNVIKYSEETPNNERYLFLQKWFIDEAEKRYKSLQAI